VGTRWQSAGAPRGDEYDARWTALAAQGRNVHGEVDLVEWLTAESGGRRILDAGCGTGRVAIELSRRGFSVTGVDADAAMLDKAQSKAPELRWLEADLAQLPDGMDAEYDVVVLAGNVMIFLAPGTEGQVVSNLGRLLTPGGLLVAGFQLRPDRFSLAQYDQHCSDAGLDLAHRWGTWDREPFTGDGYAVSVHRSAPQP
jgi:SAM-dependent methyltransferase